MKPIRVLSLFDGISCGQIALERAGIPVEVYYASEIDKYAIQITQKNYPDTIQLGDVEKIDFTQFEGKIDLLIGGSPCTNLSIAGNRKGLDGDESRLFWEYVRAIKECKPKYFLLENVESMSDKDKEIISQELGCYPCMINSSRVSAQNRKRYYWFNWGDMQYNLFGFPTCDIPQPKDKGILLKDVLESGYGCLIIDDGNNIEKSQNKASYLLARDYKGWNTFGKTGVAEPILPKQYENTLIDIAEKNNGKMPTMFSLYNKQVVEDKSPTVTANSNSSITHCGSVGVFSPIRLGEFGNGGQGERVYSSYAKSTSVISNSGARDNFAIPIRLSEYDLGKGQANKVYSVKGKSVTLLSNGGGRGAKTGLYKIDLPDGDYIIRKLTPIECERLQTMSDNFTQYGKNEKGEIVKISNTQRYKCIGNSWTVDVIAHIFSYLKDELDK